MGRELEESKEESVSIDAAQKDIAQMNVNCPTCDKIMRDTKCLSLPFPHLQTVWWGRGVR